MAPATQRGGPRRGRLSRRRGAPQREVSPSRAHFAVSLLAC
jgi:hypothetical protein